MNNRQEFPIELVVIAIFAFVVGMAVWKFSDAVGLDFAAGGKLLFGLMFACVLLALGWWQEYVSSHGFLSLRAMIPAALAVVWLGLWPALQQWGSIGPMFAGMTDETRPVEWWASGWFRWPVLAVILVPGYYIVYRQSDLYR